VLLLVPTFQPHDAVGNDVLGMYYASCSAGYQTRIFAQHVNTIYQSIAQPIDEVGESVFRDSNDILIYHHAIAWDKGEKILQKIKNKLVLKYHNVTPPSFYSDYPEHHYWACMEGRKANERLAAYPIRRLWGDSAYNAEEFIQLGVERDRCRVLPPMHRIEDLARQRLDPVVLKDYRDGRPNVLFVGGLRPNKGHKKAVDAFARYRDMTTRRPRLIFVGNFDHSLSLYVEHIKDRIRALSLDEDVVFAHSVSPSELRTYYLLASVFLCVSEHEGFCVPLVESMCFRVPIVAWDTTAVGETTGDCGLLFQDYDPDRLAEALDECVEEPVMARTLSRKGRERYEDFFHERALSARLVQLIEEVENL
jgi:glycosyltransferase involved in cell wall biosynthesis